MVNLAIGVFTDRHTTDIRESPCTNVNPIHNWSMSFIPEKETAERGEIQV